MLFDLALIPHWGMAGSAVATLIAQILGNTYLWYAMKKLNPFTILPRLWRIIGAGAVMAVVTILLYLAGVEVVINIAISAVAYAATLLFLKEPLLAELKNIAGFGTARALSEALPE